MAKLTRQQQQIFAGQAPSDMIAAFGTTQTGKPVYSTDLSTLQTTNYQQGWQDAVIADKAPFLEEMNGVQYGLSYQIAYNQQMGIPEWLSTQDYYTNSRAMGSDGNIYKSLTDDNVGNNPISDDGTNWVNILEGLYDKITNCILSAPNGVATYSDNTITVKQGLKVLFPNGRNADGTLNSIEYVVETENIETQPAEALNQNIFICEPSYFSKGFFHCQDKGLYIQETTPTDIIIDLSPCWYKPSENQWYRYEPSGTQWDKVNICPVGKYVTDSSGNVTSLTLYQPVELLKRTDKAEIAGWGMPSNKYIDLTLGASGASYTAPANGWFAVDKLSSDSNQQVWFTNVTAQIRSSSPISFTLDNGLQAIIPVKKGDEIYCFYTAGGTTNHFIFNYAEGEQ